MLVPLSHTASQVWVLPYPPSNSPTPVRRPVHEWKCYSVSHIQLFATPWTVACQRPLSMEFSRQEYWSELPFSFLRNFSIQGSNLGLLHCRWILYHLSYQRSPGNQDIFQARTLEWVAMPSSWGNFLTQGSNPGLPHCRLILYHLSHQGSCMYTYIPSLLSLPPTLSIPPL